MNALAIIKAIPTLIVIVEQLFPGQARGGEKIQALFALLESTVGELGAMRPALEKLVAKLVEIKNAVGEFKKG